ncbi:MAG: hypothetical protein Q4C06_05460 [Bacillota bacterium]|nr:hypothetical protein [Bacillota bacterium]
MVYHVGEMILQQTQEVFRGQVNDVIVCQDQGNSSRPFYTVLVVHDRTMAKKLMDLFHDRSGRAKNSFIADYTWRDSYLMVFDYIRERPLHQFFTSEVRSMMECEQLCINLTVECIAAGIPFPILYLQLLQDQINISKDRNVYLSYCIDLSEFSEDITERECATLCAQKIFDMLGQIGSEKKGRVDRITSYKLLENRSWKSGYHRFTDLYKDLKMASLPLKKDGLFKRLKLFFKHQQDRIFRMLLFLCVILGILALAMIISQIIFGDIPFLRVFINTFKTIGTESLLQ